MPLSWTKSVGFTCAGQAVSVSVTARRSDTGEPTYAVYWHGGIPTRLSGEDFAVFDRELRKAKGRLLAALEAVPYG